MTYVKPHMVESLKDHVLTVLLNTDEVKVFRMAHPDEWAYRVQITFTPEGIAIQGDVTLGDAQNGICSNLNYGLGWFSKLKSESYLCEKFLRESWQRDAVARDLDSWVSESQRELDDAIKAHLAEDPEMTREEALAEASYEQENATAWTAIRASWHDETSDKELYEEGSQHFDDFWDYNVGHDYPLDDAGWLNAIHRRFVELYKEHQITCGECERPIGTGVDAGCTTCGRHKDPA